VKIALGLLAVLAIAAAAAAVWWWEPWAEDEAVDPDSLSAEFKGSACRELAGVAAALAEGDDDPVGFLRALGKRAAGIRPGARAFADLASGGRNRIPGKGFLARFDDGTAGQARHFAGIAVATAYGGAAATRVISIFGRDDPEDSPDGRLTDEGIAFATAVLSEDLALEETPAWLLEHLCRRSPASGE
jgi:hypothetical protein